MSDPPLTEDPLVMSARCHVTEALAGEVAREVIWRACRTFFEQTRTVPIELLYSSKHQEKLMSAGSQFLGANQKVAIAQVAGTKQPVSERLKELNELTTNWQKLTRAYEARSDAVAASGQLDGLLKDLPGNPAERQALALVAVVRMLAPLKDHAQKFEAVMDLEADPSPDAVEVLDPLLGELLKTAAVTEQLLQGLPSVERRLHRLADLSGGVGEPPRDLPPTVGRLAAWLFDRPMAQSRLALQGYLFREIAGNQTLTKSGPSAELQAILKLRKRLTSKDQVLGGSVVEAAFDRRCARILNPEVIDQVIGPATSPAAQLESLLPLLGEPIGERARDFLVRMIDQTVQACQSAQRLVGDDVPPAERLKALARFYRRIRNAELREGVKIRILRAVETFHADTLNEADPLSRIEARNGGNTEKALALIDLCRSGMLLPGDYLDRARKAATTRLKAPDFIFAYLAGSQDQTQRAQRIEALKTMLVEAGISS